MLLVALDIGSSKVSMIIAQINEPKNHQSPTVEIMAATRNSSAGVKHGNIVDMKKLAPIIENTALEAGKMAGTTIKRVAVNLNGEYIESFNVRGVISLVSSSNPRPVEARDIQRVQDSARNALSIPTERVITHILPQQYIVDDVTGIRNPLDMQASRLEAEFHVVTASQVVVNNLKRTLEKAGLEMSALILTPLASAYGVTTDYEREQGVLLIDIGAETTGLVVMFENSLYHSKIIPLGGQQFTMDLASVLGISLTQAERLKRVVSSLRRNTPSRELNHTPTPSPGPPEDEDLIPVPPATPDAAPLAIPRSRVREILDARSEELMLLIREHLSDISLLDLINHVVLTGGGALLIGLDDITHAVFDLPVRIGYPVNVIGIKEYITTPIYSVGIGMIHFILQQDDLLRRYEPKRKFWQKIAHWFRTVFP